MSKAWGNIGRWADDSEAAEKQGLESSANPIPTTFPSLKESLSTSKSTKKKTKMSLHQFSLSTTTTTPPGLTPIDFITLPTRPMQRHPDEDVPRGWGGGRRVPYGDREERPPRASEYDSMPSRADETDNWAMGKRSAFDSARERTNNKYASLGSGPGMSRSDETDSWAVGKKNLPSFDSGRTNNKYTSLGSGPGGSRADEMDNWGAGKRAVVAAPGRSTFGSSFRDSGVGGTERPRLVLDPPKREVGSPVSGTANTITTGTTKPSPFGAARPREEVLAEKGLDWKKMESEIEAKKTISRPTSAHSSRPTSSHSNRSEGVGVDGAVKARPKVNPFGDAKPREVLLLEKGLDWRKIDLDLEHRRIDRPETEAEKILKEEIDNLKKELAAKQSDSNATMEPHEGATVDLHDIIRSKERDLELLIRELDDKVRFAPKVSERPGSGAGRISGPPSRSESFDEPRNMEFTERPRSRGTGDMWNRPSDNRRPFQGGMERGTGFMGGNRGMDRPRSRERW